MGGWRKLGETPLYDGYRPIVGRRYELPDGRVHEFDVKAERPVVVVLALTPALEVVLVREYRPGPEELVLELPGGGIDDGEGRIDAVRRELREETGYAGDVAAVGSMLDCAYSTRVKHVFVATACEKRGEPEPRDGELTEVVLMSLPQFREHLRGGRLTDVGPGYRALDALNLL